MFLLGGSSIVINVETVEVGLAVLYLPVFLYTRGIRSLPSRYFDKAVVLAAAFAGCSRTAVVG